MGIPSYFRKILQKYPGCLQKTKPPGIGGIYFDFNCLIYRCIRGKSMPKWKSETNKEWEEALLREIIRTVKEVIQEAGGVKKVYLGIDGVVPMAKIRQQRVRRFKSSWLRKIKQQKEGTEEDWDSNSITPGTAFMDMLSKQLEGHGWEVSGVREEGEGEHKIMKCIRKEGISKKEPLIVYGLDADLILLTMLVGEECKRKIWLMREEQEFQGGGLKQDADGEQHYVFLNIDEFKMRLNLRGYQQVLNYIGLMTLMGNDFIPHSITHKLGDDGHEYVMEELVKMIRKEGEWLVDEKGLLRETILREIAGRWAKDESEKLFHMIRKKREQAGRGVLKGMDEMEAYPLEKMVEKQLIDEEGQLVEGWRDIYSKQWIRHSTESICEEYMYGCQWVLDYYLGKEVNLQWVFPCWVPPLWSSISRSNIKEKKERNESQIKSPTPEEQLAMVLPLDSWGLIREKNHRKLPILAPQMWPEEYGFFTLGRKWLWESEAMIPILTAEYLRDILNE